ncbi:dihydroorotase, homodimeric type [Absidia repens]|uniref:Dihydroorotase, homodimeric type n=1 Tax=Absidia repens TaxID=90262 RepID=A0A1X2IV91_9FUNG|nr:dihydroorotase, homodimeric type [Absidia repens]
MTTSISIPSACDFHLHLRQGEMMKMVTPQVASGGVSLAYIMPNLQPPITNTDMALKYKAELEALAPQVTFYMTFGRSTEGKQSRYRRCQVVSSGVTTNSDAGIENYEIYYPVFQAMEEEGMVLNLHGEIPSDHQKNICVMNAEEKFLPQLEKIHNAFPKLKIVLEHATSEAAVNMVKRLGDTVACSITVHHLQLIVDDWAGQAHHFCKPVAKYPQDRQALREVVASGRVSTGTDVRLFCIGHPRFFLGTDSAPHPSHVKETAHAHAGVFTTPLVLPYLAKIFESMGSLDKLENFACHFGRQFYGLKQKDGFEDLKVTLVKEENVVVPASYQVSNENPEAGAVVPFLANKDIGWKISQNFY